MAKRESKLVTELLADYRAGGHRPIGPFVMKDHAREIASLTGWKVVQFRDWTTRHGAWVYYTVPQNMDEDFNLF